MFSHLARLSVFAPVLHDAHSRTDSAMFQFIRDHLAAAEADVTVSSREHALAALRPLGLNDFGSVLWQAPLAAYPLLSRHLPPMTPADVQKKWTGSSGETLLAQSLQFVQSAAQNYANLADRALSGQRILDFGCGYGRFLRLFSFFSDDVWGCDPWESSLEQSRSAGFADRVRKSDQIPDALPFTDPFDFAFAFSVFTHLNPVAATAALRALRRVVVPDGILCITCRPPEYWTTHAAIRKATTGLKPDEFIRRHVETGFAFHSHGSRPDDPGATFGDASFSLDWLSSRAVGWTVAALDRSLSDPMQRYIYLRAT